MKGLKGSSQCRGRGPGEHWESMGSGSQAKKGFPEAGNKQSIKSTEKHTENELLDFPIGVKGDLNKSLLKE